MTSQICVDANILLKLLLKETDSHLAEAAWQSWLADGVEMIAPPLFPFEVTSVLRKATHRGIIEADHGEKLLKTAFQFGVKLKTFPDIHKTAWHLATRFERPSVYDAHYLALAQYAGCPFWTADKKLFNAVSQKLPWVNWLGNWR